MGAVERVSVYSLMREGVSVRATRRLLQSLLVVGLVLAAVVFAVGASGSAARPAQHTASDATGGGTSGVLNLHEGSALTLALSGDDHSIVMNFMGNLWTMPATGGTATRISSDCVRFSLQPKVTCF